MTGFKTRWIPWLLCVAVVVMVFSVATPAVRAAGEMSQDQKMKWFREAKFGLFIHWGLYAIPAGEWKGKTYPGIGEWIMYWAKVPVREYEALASQFNCDPELILRQPKGSFATYVRGATDRAIPISFPFFENCVSECRPSSSR